VRCAPEAGARFSNSHLCVRLGIGVLRRVGGDSQRFCATMTELQRRLYAA
jgi:hypothetical protein